MTVDVLIRLDYSGVTYNNDPSLTQTKPMQYRKISPTLAYTIGAILGWLYAQDTLLMLALILVAGLIILGGELHSRGVI